MVIVVFVEIVVVVIVVVVIVVVLIVVTAIVVVVVYSGIELKSNSSQSSRSMVESTVAVDESKAATNRLSSESMKAADASSEKSEGRSGMVEGSE